MLAFAYHSISDENDPICIPPDIFESQIRFLAINGFTATTTENLSFDKNKVFISFDDGFRNVYTTAFPILEKYGFKGTVFINPFNISKEDIRLNVQELKVLLRNGWAVQHHGFSHEILTLQNFETFDHWHERVTTDILKTKCFFSENLGYNPEYIAYPYGIYSSSLAETLKENGFKNCFSIEEGLNLTDTFTLKRFNISGTEAVKNFTSVPFYQPLNISKLSFSPGQEIDSPESISGFITTPGELSEPICFRIITSSVFNNGFIDSIETELFKKDNLFYYRFSINFRKSLNYGFYTLKAEGKIKQITFITSYSFFINRQ